MNKGRDSTGAKPASTGLHCALHPRPGLPPLWSDPSQQDSGWHCEPLLSPPRRPSSVPVQSQAPETGVPWNLPCQVCILTFDNWRLGACWRPNQNSGTKECTLSSSLLPGQENSPDMHCVQWRFGGSTLLLRLTQSPQHLKSICPHSRWPETSPQVSDEGGPTLPGLEEHQSHNPRRALLSFP